MLHTHQQSFPVTQPGDRSLPETSFVPRPGSPFAVDGWCCCYTALHRKARLEDLAFAEEILLSSA